MDVPDKYQELVKEFIQQLEYMEIIYGTIPKIKVMTQKDYEKLVNHIKRLTGEISS